MTGKVHIVGAGPGAADLLTVKAASLLRTADVVLYDDLVPQEILDLIPPSAEIINVGKRCGRHGKSQQQINELMVECASRHNRIVRLKSGDPAVFGRLGEELDALREAGVPQLQRHKDAAGVLMSSTVDDRQSILRPGGIDVEMVSVNT